MFPLWRRQNEVRCCCEENERRAVIRLGRRHPALHRKRFTHNYMAVSFWPRGWSHSLHGQDVSTVTWLAQTYDPYTNPCTAAFSQWHTYTRTVSHIHMDECMHALRHTHTQMQINTLTSFWRRSHSSDPKYVWIVHGGVCTQMHTANIMTLNHILRLEHQLLQTVPLLLAWQLLIVLSTQLPKW